MKEIYVSPNVEVIEFDVKDVITTSGLGELSGKNANEDVNFSEWSQFH